MKKPFDYDKAKEGHPLIIRAGNKAYYIGRHPEGNTFPHVAGDTLNPPHGEHVFRVDNDGCVSLQGPKENDVFLDCPGSRTLRVEELPILCSIRKGEPSWCPGNVLLVTGRCLEHQTIFVAYPEGNGTNIYKLEDLRKNEAEWFSILPPNESEWRKFEVAE